MFRAKEGSRLNATIVPTVRAASPQVNSQRLLSGLPKPIETMGAFQFFQQSQRSSPARMSPKAIAQASSGGHSLGSRERFVELHKLPVLACLVRFVEFGQAAGYLELRHSITADHQRPRLGVRKRIEVGADRGQTLLGVFVDSIFRERGI